MALSIPDRDLESGNCLISGQEGFSIGWFSVFPLFYFAGFSPTFSGISLQRDQAGIMLVWSPDILCTHILYTQALHFQEVTSRVSQAYELTSPPCPRGDSLMLELMSSVQPSSPSSCQPWLCTLEFQVLSQKLTFTLRTKNKQNPNKSPHKTRSITT